MNSKKINVITTTTDSNGEANLCFNKDKDNRIPLGKYKLQVDYICDSDSEKEDMEVIELIVGHSMNTVTSQPVTPYSTTATTEKTITDNEKLNTKTTIAITAYDSTTNKPVQGVTFGLRVLPGQNGNIYQTSDDSTQEALYSLWEAATDLELEGTTDKNGYIEFKNVTFDTLFDSVDDIQRYNAFILRCDGTNDLDVNMIPLTVVTPFLAGTQPVHMIVTPNNIATNGDGITCGGGGITIDVGTHYHFPYSSSDEIRGSFYQEWDDNHVLKRSGKSTEYFTIEETTGYNKGDWTPIPYSRVKQAENGNKIASTEEGNAAIMMGDGGCKFIYLNNRPYSTQGRINYRIKYTGVIGKTESTTSGAYTLQLSPTHPSDVLMDAVLELFNSSDDTLNVYKYEDADITISLKRKVDNTNIGDMASNIEVHME